MWKICSVSISPNIYLKVFMFRKFFTKSQENLLKCLEITPIPFRSLSKIFFKFFSQISLPKLLRLFYLKISHIIFYQTFHTNFSKISSEVTVILSNCLVSSILKEKSEFFDNFIRWFPVIFIALPFSWFTDKNGLV